MGIVASPEDLDAIRKVFVNGYHADISSTMSRDTFKKEIGKKLKREPDFRVRDALKNIALLALRGHVETFEIGLSPDTSLFLHFALFSTAWPSGFLSDLENVKGILRENLPNHETKSTLDLLKKVTVDSIDGIAFPGLDSSLDSSLVLWDGGSRPGTHIVSLLSFNNAVFFPTTEYLFKTYAKRLAKILVRLPEGRPADQASAIQPIPNVQLGETLFHLKR